MLLVWLLVNVVVVGGAVIYVHVEVVILWMIVAMPDVAVICYDVPVPAIVNVDHVNMKMLFILMLMLLSSMLLLYVLVLL